MGTRDFAHAHCDSEGATRGPPDGTLIEHSLIVLALGRAYGPPSGSYSTVMMCDAMRCDAMHSVSLERRASLFLILGFCSILMSHIQFITRHSVSLQLRASSFFIDSRFLFDLNVAHSIHHGVRRVCASWKLCGSRTGHIRLLCRYYSIIMPLCVESNRPICT